MDNIIREISRNLYYGMIKPNFINAGITDTIIQEITNECKSTSLDSYADSPIPIRSVYLIVISLLNNTKIINKDAVQRLNHYDAGINRDITFREGFSDSITVRKTMILDCEGIDENDLIDDEQKKNAKEEMRELYDKLAEEIIINYPDKKKLPKMKLNTIAVRMVKRILFNSMLTEEDFKTRYKEILKKYFPSYTERQYDDNVLYRIQIIFSEAFQKEVIQIISENGLMEQNSKNKITFEQLKHMVVDAIYKRIEETPRLKKCLDDIVQIERDKEALLIGYMSEISEASPQRIKDIISCINNTTVFSDSFSDVDINTGYRERQVSISTENEEIETIKPEKISKAMDILCEDIHRVLQSKDAMTTEEYMDEIFRIKYRFLRIHPFPDSNGRNSRILFNMLAMEKGKFLIFRKDNKSKYRHVLNVIGNRINSSLTNEEYSYLDCLTENPDLAKDHEVNAIKGIYERFIQREYIGVLKDLESEDRDINAYEKLINTPDKIERTQE